MDIHGQLLRIYKSPIIYRLLSYLHLHTAIKDVYWQVRRIIDGLTRYTVNGTTVTLERYSIPSHLEKPIITDLLDRVKSDDVFYDIGADRGWYSCVVGKTISEGRVICFEPHPSRRRVLRRNVKRNGIQSQVSYRSEALSNVNGAGQFGNAIHPQGVGELSVPLVRGDDLIASEDIPEPDVMKIDVEGAEMNVLEGFSDTIAGSKPRLIYIELHSNVEEFGSSWDDIRRYLLSNEFTIAQIHERGGQAFWRATRTDDN